MPPRIPLDEFGCKRCGTCGTYKPLSEFQKAARTVDGVMWQCKACAKIARRKQYVESPDHFTAYRESKREEARIYSHIYYQQNSEEVRRKGRERWRKTSIEKKRNWKQSWRKQNPDKRKAYDHMRKSRKYGNGGSFTASEWNALKIHYNYTCLCCKKSEPKIKLTPDHVVPLTLGGSNNILNIQPLCISCNSSKAHRHTTDYRH